MSNARQRVLADCFSLEEHPFDPQLDARRKLDFRRRGVSLTKPLDVFNVEELKDYFIRTGPFKDAVEQVKDFLTRTNYPNGGAYPPAFLIHGDKGVGRSTMASFLGYQIKKRNPAGASFNNVPVVSENVGKLLFSIKNYIRLHINKFQLPNCNDALNFYSNTDINPADPSLDYLRQIFVQLATCMVASPPLILEIESITYVDRKEWMSQLYDYLKPLNIVLIFMTEDPRVFHYFQKQRNLGRIVGQEVSLEPLDRQMAEEFLTSRLANFRSAQSPVNKAGLFPFAAQILNQTFPPGTKIGIKRLESMFHGAFNLKLDQLSGRYVQPGQPPNPPIRADELLIPFESVGDYLQGSIRQRKP